MGYSNDDYEDEEYGMQFEGDERTLTMEQLEEILCENFGNSEYDRTSGCRTPYGWLSIDNILWCVSEGV